MQIPKDMEIWGYQAVLQANVTWGILELSDLILVPWGWALHMM